MDLKEFLQSKMTEIKAGSTDNFVDLGRHINLNWEDKLVPGGVWAFALGSTNFIEDSEYAQKWFESRYPGKTINQVNSARVSKEFTEHVLDNIPEGVTVKLKGHALQSQNKPGTEYGKGAKGIDKDKLYAKWWEGKPGFTKHPTAGMLYSKPKGIVHPKGSIIDSNNLRDPLQQDIDQGLPTSKQEAVNRGINVYQDENGKTWKLRYKKRKKTETFNGKEYSFEREGWETWKQGKRTHHQNRRTNWKNKLLTKQDYYDYADKNGIDRSIADQKYNQNQLRLKSRQLRSGKNTPWIIEHLNPQSNPEGGVEHWRNNVLWTPEVNHPKSDIIPSIEALKAAGVPLSKEDALRLDFADDPGVPTKEARRIILEDIQSQLKGGNPKRARFIRRAIGATATATAGLVSSPLKTLAAIPDVVPATYAFDALSLGATHLDKWGTQQLPDDHVYKSGATKQQALDWLNRQIGADVVGLEPTGIGNIPAVLNQQLDPRETEEQKRARGEQAIENVSIMQQHGMNPFF